MTWTPEPPAFIYIKGTGILVIKVFQIAIKKIKKKKTEIIAISENDSNGFSSWIYGLSVHRQLLGLNIRHEFLYTEQAISIESC